MKNKTLGGTLLVVGTSIGGGIFGLPIANAAVGFVPTLFLIVGCWAFMTFCALLVLEVNLHLPEDSNIVSMAHRTLGSAGRIVAWLTYLLLFYALISLYVAGNSQIIQHLGAQMGAQLPMWLAAGAMVGVLTFVIWCGIHTVDVVNRILMTSKLFLFIALIWLIVPHTNMTFLQENRLEVTFSAIMVIITSFGYATTVPSVRPYLQSDPKKLRRAILMGSLIPLVCYFIWDLMVIGSLPLEGEHGLLHIQSTGDATTGIPLAFHHMMHKPWVTTFMSIFAPVCVTTSVLAVSLGLSDFLADGLKRPKRGFNQVIVYGLTFIPPFLLVIVYPHMFIVALGYAGTLCVILLGLLPCLMAWSSRYCGTLSSASTYRVMGGKPLLVFMITLAVVMIVVSFLSDLHFIDW